MILSDLQNEVYVITKRPDKVSDTLSALRAALTKAHTMDFWTKDIYETGIQFTAAATQQSFLYKSLIPLWRAVSYITPLDGTTFIPVGSPLTLITPQFIIDQYDYYKEDVFYEAGQVIQIRTQTGYQYFGVGAYLFPDVSINSQLQTWITQDFPYSVIYEAAARVFRLIGFTEQAKEAQNMADEMMALIRISNVTAQGS